MKIHKVFLYQLVFLLLLSLLQVGFAECAAVDRPTKMKPSHFKCQIMKDQGLSRYDKIILLQMIHRQVNAEMGQVFSKIDGKKSGCTNTTCVKPEKWLNETGCQNMQLQVIIGAASTGGRVIGMPLLEPFVHLAGIHCARAYDCTKSQADSPLWFGWGRVMRWYQ